MHSRKELAWNSSRTFETAGKEFAPDVRGDRRETMQLKMVTEMPKKKTERQERRVCQKKLRHKTLKTYTHPNFKRSNKIKLCVITSQTSKGK